MFFPYSFKLNVRSMHTYVNRSLPTHIIYVCMYAYFSQRFFCRLFKPQSIQSANRKQNLPSLWSCELRRRHWSTILDSMDPMVFWEDWLWPNPTCLGWKNQPNMFVSVFALISFSVKRKPWSFPLIFQFSTHLKNICQIRSVPHISGWKKNMKKSLKAPPSFATIFLLLHPGF